jgi:hypothetical protein
MRIEGGYRLVWCVVVVRSRWMEAYERKQEGGRREGITGAYHLGVDDLQGSRLRLRLLRLLRLRRLDLDLHRHLSSLRRLRFPAFPAAHDLHRLRFLVVAVAVDIGLDLVVVAFVGVFHFVFVCVRCGEFPEFS